MKIQILAISLLTIGLTACQTTTTSPIIQRENKLFETTGLGKTKIIAQQNAINSANAQCGRLQSPIVVTDEVKYNGVLDENLGRVADKAISVLGGILGSKTSIARDDDYEYKISFRCE